MWQVQYDVKGSERFEVNLNTTSFATKEEERDGRFTLYPTQNMWTFILLDLGDTITLDLPTQHITGTYAIRTQTITLKPGLPTQTELREAS